MCPGQHGLRVPCVFRFRQRAIAQPHKLHVEFADWTIRIEANIKRSELVTKMVLIRRTPERGMRHREVRRWNVLPTSVMTLPDEILRARARRIRFVVTDVDGVLTDAGVWYAPSGEAMKRFSLRDGLGVERLRNVGVETAFLTGEDSRIVARRADKLGVKHCWLGVRDKLPFLVDKSTKLGIPLECIAYIGDDYNDLDVMRTVRESGLTGTPADGMPRVREVAHHVGTRRGGSGAFREFAEWLLALRESSCSPRGAPTEEHWQEAAARGDQSK